MSTGKKLLIGAGVALLAVSTLGPINANASVNMRNHPDIVNNSEISGPAVHTDYQYNGNYFSTNAYGTIISLNGKSHPSDYEIDVALGLPHHVSRAHRRQLRIRRIRKARARQRKARARRRKASLIRVFVNRANRKLRTYNSLMKKAQKRHNKNRANYYRGMIDGTGNATDVTSGQQTSKKAHRWLTRHLRKNSTYKKGWIKGYSAVSTSMRNSHDRYGSTAAKQELYGYLMSVPRIAGTVTARIIAK